MAERGTAGTRRRRRDKRKRTSRKREKLVSNLAWMAGGLAVGLPLLALTITSRHNGEANGTAVKIDVPAGSR